MQGIYATFILITGLFGPLIYFVLLCVSFYLLIKRGKSRYVEKSDINENKVSQSIFKYKR